MKQSYLLLKLTFLLLFFGAINQNLQAQVSGKVFRDFNANGIQTTAAPDPIEPGLKDVTVNAYDATGVLNTATTIADGTYSISGGTAPYRVEFVLPTGYFASNGNISNTTIQFVAAGGTANLGVNYPADYCQANPDMATNIYINGDNTTGSSGTADVLGRFPYNSTGTSPAYNRIGGATDAGTTWGLAYQKETKKLFSAAYLKRHAGFGPSGTGGIYVTDMTTNITTAFVNIASLGIVTGADPHTDLVGDKSQPSTDAASFLLVGKVSFGDMDISDDGKYLYVVNMNTRQVHKIFINNPAVAPTLATDITSYNIPNPCGNTDYRPFGLKFRNGKLYVGVTCSEETSQTQANLSGNVYEMDATTGVFNTTPVLSFPLNYTKGFAWSGLASTSNQFYPWLTNWTSAFKDVGNAVICYPQPMLSDIEFDVDGSMIIGFRDRFCDQVGVYNNMPDGTNPNLEGVSGGDILRAAPNGSNWTIEANGVSGSLTSGAANGEGPGGSEFYKGDEYNPAFSYGHQEIGDGGLALLPGSGQVAMTAFDALSSSTGGLFNRGGVRTLNNTDGSFANGFQMYDSGGGSSAGTFEKSNGLGDLEILCNAAPIEIGNRVFMDTDKDGEQDAGEMGIDGITVKLFKAGTEVASTTTANGGQWYFSNLDPNTDYEVKILSANIPSGKSLTTSNTASNAKDLIDSDATLVGSDAVITYKTGSAGQNNHSLDFGFKTAGCSITLKPNVSGCYQNGGASKATVSVEVAWGTPPSGNITVTLGGQTRTITPGVISVNYGYTTGSKSQTIVSPQIVAFELPADASSQTIEAFFGASYAAATCKATQSITLPAACPPTACTSGTDMGGNVFNDYNANGTKDTGETTGLQGVTVTAIACDGTTYTTTTDVFGKYTLNVPAAKYPVRVEFTGLPALYGQGTPNGTDGRTTTQFVAAADCNVDLGVLDRNDYCQNNPNIYVPIFGNGDPTVPGTAATANGIVGFPYDYTGLPSVSGYTAPFKVAEGSQVGSLWGTAYNKTTKRLFQSAFLRRHAGLGNSGLGGIYVTNITNPASPTVAAFLNVETDLGVDLDGTVNPVLSNGLRGLVGDKAMPSNDPSTISQVGRAGMGDLDISEDGNKLWFTNLFDRKLYSIDITAYNGDNTTKPTSATAFTIPDPGCVGGVARPFGLKIYKNEVYVGVVCDASASQNKSDLRAFVYKFNGTTWTTVFDFPLTYPKGYGHLDNNIVTRTGWYPWTDDWNLMSNPYRLSNGTKRTYAYPTPLLSDIEFDIDGSMVLAFLDRTGIVSGSRNYGPTGTGDYTGLACGDILKAYYSGGTYILENAAKAGPFVGANPTNNQGPGFGEFYEDNFIYTYDGGSEILDHAEIAFGALALRPGSNEVISTTFDPLGMAIPNGYNPNPFDVGGIMKSNNTTGLKNSGYAVYKGELTNGKGLFGKSVGLGDIELACANPTYLEIGNYVWEDTNKDGVQDACEPPLANVKVSLYKAGVKIAETTTNASGEYYFSSKSKLGAAWTGTGADTALIATTAYKVVFGETQYTSSKLTVNSKTYEITTIDATANTGNDQNDSDISDMAIGGGTYPSINVTTGAAGSVNHTLDAGFKVACVLAASLASTNPKCAAGTDGTVTLTVTGAVGTPTYLWSNAATTKDLAAVAAGTYSVTVTDGACTATASVTLTDPSAITLTCSKTDATTKSGTDGTATVLASGGTGAYTYLWSNAKTTASITGLTAATYTVTVTDANGCAKVCSSVVGEPGCNVSASLASTNPKCAAGTDGTVTLTVTGAVGTPTYLWSNAATTKDLAAVAAGTYSVTVTDGACTATASVTLTDPSAITLTCSKTDATTKSGTDGTATVVASGGTGAYTYLWSNAKTTASITGLTAATYTVTVTDANGCTKVCSSVVGEPGCNVSASLASTNPKCAAGTDGTVTLTVTGAVGTPTYLWSNAATTKDLSAVAAGTYSVTVTDGACTATASVTLTDPSAITLTCSKTNATTKSGTDGTATVVASGGTGAYTYLWSNAKTTASITGLTAATYTVTVTDANGCTKVCSSVVGEPGACSLDVTSVTKGACYDNGAGQMVYDLTINVAWANAPSGEPIIVTTDAGGSETIDATTLTSPQTVILTTLPGDGLATVATAAFLATTTCIDTLKYTAPNCTPAPLGTISGKFWKDTNNDGLENNGELVFGGVKVELFASNASGMPTGAALQTVTTTSTGLYNFSNLPQGDYVVKIDKTTIMTGMELGTKKDVGTNDVIDNDFDATSGLSDKIVLNPNNPATKDFPNVNAAIINSIPPCPTKICTPVKVTKL